MPLETGEMVHIIERRQFETDVRRHFFGVVSGATDAAIRVTGYVFVYDPIATNYIRHDEQRTRLIPLSNGLIINIAPAETTLEDVHYELSSAGKLKVTDGGAFSLAINEFGQHR